MSKGYSYEYYGDGIIMGDRKHREQMIQGSTELLTALKREYPQLVHELTKDKGAKP